MIAAVTASPIAQVQDQDRARAILTIVSAFANDPVERWLFPDLAGAGVDETAIAAVLTDAVDPEQHEDMFSVLEQMDRAHPTFEHWYLPWLGVVPDGQGSGLGGRLLEHGLGIVDQSHLPAYLETPNPRTLAFYERRGFVVTAESQAGSCLPVISMLRDAR
jgi:GNAT superfamily N-acetyltransferase